MALVRWMGALSRGLTRWVLSAVGGMPLAAVGLTVMLGIPAGLAQAQAGEEVPFITTPDHVTRVMLELAGVSEKDFVLDLGSGDGRIVITAAKHHGARGLGVEIDPQLVERSRANAIKAGVADRAEFREQDLFKTDLGVASVITMYLLPAVNLQLRPLILNLKPGTRIVSHDWDMGDWQPDRSRVVEVPDKKVGLEKFSRLHLWTVPAKLQGAWCGEGAARGWRFEFVQQYQQAQGRLLAVRTAAAATPPPQALQGRLLGAEFFTNNGLGLRVIAPVAGGSGSGTPSAVSAAAGGAPGGGSGLAHRLEITRSSGPWAALAGAQFIAVGQGACTP